MPNIKSQKKRVVTNAKEQSRNKAVKSDLKTALKKAESSLVAGVKKEDAAQVAKDAFSTIDTARRKGVIHKNTANRKKAAIGRKISSQ